jgi:ABC-2 type transport system ATP-binding protein
MKSEVEQYILHGDYSLAIRRIMDLALDSQSPELIKRATQFSQSFRRRIIDNNEIGITAEFQNDSSELLNSLSTNLSIPNQNGEVLLQGNAISKKYKHGNFSLKPMNLNLHSGEIIGVVGENGNGKTTLLRCLAGQLAIDSGYISYSELKDPDFYSIKSHVAFIPQRIPRWFGRLKDNLHFSAAIANIRGERNDMMVEFMLERFGLTEYADLNWNQISSGYRTRFEIARVLLMQPHILILDEPLANLDINAQQTLLTDLRFLAKSSVNKIAVLLTSQQLHEVEKTADTVLLIRRGECIFQTGQVDFAAMGYALELETPSSREAVTESLNSLEVQIQFNGGFFTVISHKHNAQEIMKQLVLSGIIISYSRDISSSTKRLF